MRRSVVDKMSLDELLKLEQGLRQNRLGVQLAEAIAGEAITYSLRLASVNKQEGVWNHALIERFPANKACKSRIESWIMFKPEDIELAKTFHSYSYWKHALESGETVLCQVRVMGWNTLCESDVIIAVVESEKDSLTEWNFYCHQHGYNNPIMLQKNMKCKICATKEASKKFGLC